MGADIAVEMVLFHCTFLALRRQDNADLSAAPDDWELSGEQELFGGQIVEDNYLHALRIFRDRNSEAVRLQASVHGGEMKYMPVWTAFITHQLSSKEWMSQTSSYRVLLRYLTACTFTSDFVQPRTPAGGVELLFKYSTDAKAFMKTIRDVAELTHRPIGKAALP